MRHYFCLLGGAEAVIAWLDEHGVKASPSDSGRIAEQVLVSVGGIRGTTLLADRDTLKLWMTWRRACAAMLTARSRNSRIERSMSIVGRCSCIGGQMPVPTDGSA